MKTKTILVIGSNGQLGTDMVRICKGAGYRTIGLDYPDVDITIEDATLTCIQKHHPDYIINCAAYTAVDNCETHPKEAFALNAEGPRILAVGAKAIDATLVHISTDYVFDGTKTSPYIETDPPNPSTIYGKSKLEGERLVATHCEKHLIFRIAWLYGIHGNNFVKAIRNNALKKSASKEPMLVVNDQTGTPTYTVEVCLQILNTIERDLFGIFHCTCEGTCTWYDFAAKIIEAAGINVTLEPCTTSDFPRPAPRPHYSVLENARLKQSGINIVSDWKTAFNKFLLEEKQSNTI